MLTKVVNGKTVILSHEEETAITQEWDDNLSVYTEETRISSIREEVKRRIINQVPSATLKNYITKELNQLMRFGKLSDLRHKGVILTVEQKAELKIQVDLELYITNSRKIGKAARVNGDSLEKCITDLDIAGL